jgi:uncharacterized protein YhhL (DUF1145 family)
MTLSDWVYVFFNRVIMISTVFNLLKVAVVFFYLIVLVSLLVDSLLGYRIIFISIVAVLLAAHVTEFLIMKNRLAQVSGSANVHFLNVLLFGFLYWIPLLYSGKNK